MSPFLPPKASILSPTTPVQPDRQSKPTTGRKPSVDAHRSYSISSWVKNILPSHRPERRGTLRRRGYWEQQELTHSNQHEAHFAALGRRSRRSATAGSNHITEWNLARDLSDGGKTRRDCEENMVLDADRKWSWAPGEDAMKSRTDIPDMEQVQGASRTDQNRANSAAVNSLGPQPPSAAELQNIEAKKETRQLRRNLKESGDYLGVQGFNPETSQLDVVTSTESDRSSSLSQETQQKLLILRNTLRDARHSYKSAKERNDSQVKKIPWKNEKEKHCRLEKEKEAAKEINKTIKWKRHARQWSSAQEPDLSPIAQSIVGTAETSRRESHNQNSKLEHHDSMSNLIDLDSSCKTSFPTSAMHGDQPLAQSPDSAATVVKTSQGQSLADPTALGSSAWELFVNGISFDSSDEPVPAKDPEASLAGSERTHIRQLENSEQPVLGRKSNKCQETHYSVLREELKQNNANIEPTNHGSFLDLRRQRQEDPRGETAIINSLATAMSKYTKPSIRPRRLHLPHNVVNLSSQCKKDKGGPTTINCNKKGEESQSSSMMTMEQVLRKRQSEGIQPTQEKPVIATGSRGKLMQTWGHWIPRRRGSRSFQSSQDNTASHTAAGLETIPQIPDSWATDLTSRLGQQIFAHRPETNQRVNTNSTIRQQTGTEVEELHRLSSITETSKHIDKDKDILARDNRESLAWKEVETKQPVPVSYACIPITTTTGCGQQDLQVSSRANTQPDTKNPSTLRLERHLGGMASDLPLAARSERNLGAAVMKPLRNQWRSVGQANHGIGTDTMLKKRHIQIDERMERSTRPVAKTGNTATPDVVVSKPEERVGASKAIKSLKKPVVHGVDKRSRVVSKISTELKDASIRTECKLAMPEQTRPMAQQDEPDGLSDASQGPGSFPDLNVIHTGGDGCQSSSSGDTATDTVSHMAITEYLETVRCHLLAFFLLYWEIVGPVFNSRSEYWARNRRHESTLGDCFALLLALPGAILAVMGLV
ncbi:hypothetical protein H634G_01741 [Metarhizium anisopliae BRIP 53293]|uniref:Uncharacterized protein n=1 Tax=Metarhizium anisopliae BRIP 53293 TaxID=1291518 RepID=A0A0D9PBG6_METAN|nr:hypothetical protein H634G_01741 [Metarhizium anisopliae BRIP 53293]